MKSVPFLQFLHESNPDPWLNSDPHKKKVDNIVANIHLHVHVGSTRMHGLVDLRLTNISLGIAACLILREPTTLERGSMYFLT